MVGGKLTKRPKSAVNVISGAVDAIDVESENQGGLALLGKQTISEEASFSIEIRNVIDVMPRDLLQIGQEVVMVEIREITMIRRGGRNRYTFHLDITESAKKLSWLKLEKLR
ncbi:hypothetical protein QE152_g27522 [Popillia japonica]|uniref:Uncharacterized protein n=1 Tax=Popillia japonica TaxID=7064 RepID=A0AAW1JVG0_POPJA